MPALRGTNISLRYNGNYALEKVSFELQMGTRTAIVGPNGAGKSTLFKIIAGVLSPSEGSVKVYGHEPGSHICIAYVPQKSQVDWSFPVSVADVVMMGRVGAMGLFRHRTARDVEIVQQAINEVGLAGLAKRQISQLSGGQQQRMFIARALAQEAEIMLLDEPLTGLDVNSQEDIFKILNRIQERKVTVLVTLHDLKLAAERFDQVMLLNHRLLGFGTPDDVFKRERLIEAYGEHLHLLPSKEGILAIGDTCCDEGVSYNA
jgi:manganese/iron transport system ATP-binding protein